MLLRLHEAAPPRHLRRVFAIAERLRPWSMIEVFVFGVFVAYVKLGDLVHITLDVGVYALLALTVVLIWADSALDREAVWQRLRHRKPDDVRIAAVRRHLGHDVGCEVCGLVSTPRPNDPRCPRCDTRLHTRKPDSIAPYLGARDCRRCALRAGKLLPGADRDAARCGGTQHDHRRC